jgi:hypothetical protein
MRMFSDLVQEISIKDMALKKYEQRLKDLIFLLETEDPAAIEQFVEHCKATQADITEILERLDEE